MRGSGAKGQGTRGEKGMVADETHSSEDSESICCLVAGPLHHTEPGSHLIVETVPF